MVGTAAAVSLMMTQDVQAAGFQITTHNAKATAMAGVGAATIDDPSAIFYNPAGLTSIKGTAFQAGVTLIRAHGEFEGAGLQSTNPNFPADTTGKTASKILTIPSAFAARQLSSKAFVGFGFYVPYAQSVGWEDPDNFAGRTSLREISLRTFFLTPSIALKLSDNFSVALGLSLVPATVFLSRTLGAADDGAVLFPASQYGSEGTVDLTGSAFGVGATFGAQLTLLDHLRLGLTYRSAVELQFSGNADFNLPTGIAPEIEASFPDQTVKAEVTLPHSFDLGIGWTQGALAVEFQAGLTLWNSFDALTIDFDLDLPSDVSSSVRNWKVVPTFRLGGQYSLGELALRGGLAYDATPSPDETLDPVSPDRDRIIFSAGAGYDFGFFRADLAYMGLYLLGRTIEAGQSITFARDQESRYNGGMVHLVGITLGFQI